MDIKNLKEHDLYVLRAVIGGLEEERSIDPAIARQFEQVIDGEIARQSVTDENVRAAIEHIESHLEYLNNKRPTYEHALPPWILPQIKCYETALTALKQMRTEPIDEDIKHAIDQLTYELDGGIFPPAVTNEEIKEAIEQLSKPAETVETTELTFGRTKTVITIHSINDTNRQLAVTALQEYKPWVTDNENLPTPFEPVIISMYNGKAVGVGKVDKDGIWYGANDRKLPCLPDGWKPLPQPLKGE